MVNRFNMKLKGKKLALPYPEDSSSLASKDAEAYQSEFSTARLAFEALVKGRRSRLLEPFNNRRAYYPISAGEKVVDGFKRAIIVRPYVESIKWVHTEYSLDIGGLFPSVEPRDPYSFPDSLCIGRERVVMQQEPVQTDLNQLRSFKVLLDQVCELAAQEPPHFEHAEPS
jgi:hypothetical protein